jgi:hypothetical protein
MKKIKEYETIDGKRHASLRDAKNHALDQMGAAMFHVFNDVLASQYLIKATENLVIAKKYDMGIFDYVKWRTEYQEAESLEKRIMNGEEME